MTTPFGQQPEALKAIRDSIISSLTSPPEGKKVTKLVFTYNADGDIETIVFKQDAEALFTLNFGYDVEKNLTSITRS